MDRKREAQEIMELVDTIAMEAFELPAAERPAFLKARIGELRDDFARASVGDPEKAAIGVEFGDRLEEWTEARLKMLEQSSGTIGTA